MNPKLSFIIPAYNCNKYISDCILSLLRQDLAPEDYEIIIINDGSTDNTINILTDFQEKYKNIKVYDQENHGRDYARNQGVKKAKGDYIWFIDNDDYITANCIKTLLFTAQTLNLELFAVAPPNKYIEIFPQDFNLKTDVSDIINGKEFLLNDASYWAPWQFIIKRSFYLKHQFEFKLRYFLEDIELFYRIFYYTERFAALKNYSCYSYVKRPESETMNPWTENKVKDYARYINKVEDFINNCVTESQFIKFFEILRTQFYINGLNNWKTIKTQMPLSSYLSEIHNRPKVRYGSHLAHIYQHIAIKYPQLFTKLK